MRPSSWIAPRPWFFPGARTPRGCAGLSHVGGRRREGGVAGVDLARVDQRLAIEAEIARLGAFGTEPIDIGDVAVRAIQRDETVDARGKHAVQHHRNHGRAARQHADAGFARDVVGPNTSRQPRLRILRLRGQLLACSTPRAVSIMIQSRIAGSAFSAANCDAIVAMSSTLDTLAPECRPERPSRPSPCRPSTTANPAR